MSDCANMGSETEHIEFKKTTEELKEAVISIVAILNKHGRGTLYFGVKNNGDVVGQIIEDSTLRKVSHTILDHISPTVYPSISRLNVGGKDIIEVSFEGHQRPYLAYNIPRIRVSDEDRVMSQDQYDNLIRERQNKSKSWESQVSKYTISDVDEDSFRTYLQKAKEAGRIVFNNSDVREVLTKLELIQDNYLLNAGAALFVDSGTNELQMAKFASDRKLTFTDIRRYTGSIILLYEKATQYLIDAMDWRVEFDGSPERKEIPEIPVKALREALINAFAHRVIESGQSVEVDIYRSYLDIISYGTFPEGVTPEMFTRGNMAPVRRNPLITRTLYYSKDMESFATGLKRIQDMCDESNVKVEFICDKYFFRVRFFRYCSDYGTQSGTQQIKDKIIMIVESDNKVTRAKIAEQLGISVRTLQRIINDADTIYYVGHGKSGHWEFMRRSRD